MAEPGYPMLQKAIVWAAQLHEGQERDGAFALPYITHPLEVLTALRFVEGETNESALAAAVLHDVIEECGVTVHDIQERMSPDVADLVQQLTREEPSPAKAKELSSDDLYALRSDLLLGGIRKMSPMAQKIKLADRFCNLRDSERTRKGKKRKRYQEQSHRILEIIPRNHGPALWDAIRDILEDSRDS